jgi:hypothetical protein
VRSNLWLVVRPPELDRQAKRGVYPRAVRDTLQWFGGRELADRQEGRRPKDERLVTQDERLVTQDERLVTHASQLQQLPPVKPMSLYPQMDRCYQVLLLGCR